MENQSEEMNMVQTQKEGDTLKQSPGLLLKDAREKLGLSIAEVASFLNLSKQVIRILENDEYTKLPAITFAKGYLRAYAKYLNLNADEVIRQFNTLGLVEQEHAPHTQHALSQGVRMSDRPVKWLTYFIALSLSCLVLIWWHNYANVPIIPSSTSVTAEENAVSSTPSATTSQTSPQTNNTEAATPATTSSMQSKTNNSTDDNTATSTTEVKTAKAANTVTNTNASTAPTAMRNQSSTSTTTQAGAGTVSNTGATTVKSSATTDDITEDALLNTSSTTAQPANKNSQDATTTNTPTTGETGQTSVAKSSSRHSKKQSVSVWHNPDLDN